MENNKYNISVTDKAVQEIKKQLDKRNTPESALRLGVRSGGCEGFSYLIAFEDAPPRERDLTFVFDTVRIIVDKKSILFLDCMTLDWETTLMHSGFLIQNPNEKSSCGCSKSFSV